MYNKSKIVKLVIFSIAAVTMAACSKNNSTSPTAGSVNFEMTDAPIDDANIQGCFVTVTAIKVNGKTIDNFSGKATFDISAYQKGQTKSLGNTNLDAGTYSNITLVLDNAYDQNGTAPGCYMMTKSGDKKAIASAASTTEVMLTGQVKSIANQSSTTLMDFDLRKTISYDGASGYKFVSNGELTSGIRVMQKSETGVIKGTMTQSTITSSDKIVVYAYKKGTYNKSTETKGQGNSNVEFKNTVTSSVVSNGSYELDFLESGDYELHIISYKDKNNDGKQEIQGEFQASILGSLYLSALSVTANATVTANISVAAIIP